MTESLSSRLFDAEAVIDGMFILPAPKVPEKLRELFEGDDALPEELMPFVKGWSDQEIEELLDAGRDAWEGLSDCISEHGKQLVFLTGETPVFTYWPGGQASYSWGHTWNLRVVADTFDEAVEKLLAQVEERRAYDKTRKVKA